MRDPRRIDELLELIGAEWKKNPDLRLCQLISNAAGFMYGRTGDLFHFEDIDLRNAIYWESKITDEIRKKLVQTGCKFAFRAVQDIFKIFPKEYHINENSLMMGYSWGGISMGVESYDDGDYVILVQLPDGKEVALETNMDGLVKELRSAHKLAKVGFHEWVDSLP